MSAKEDPNSPERIEALRRSIQEFRRGIERGEITGDVIHDAPTDPAPPPVRYPLRRLKEPPADGDR